MSSKCERWTNLSHGYSEALPHAKPFPIFNFCIPLLYLNSSTLLLIFRTEWSNHKLFSRSKSKQQNSEWWSNQARWSSRWGGSRMQIFQDLMREEVGRERETRFEVLDRVETNGVMGWGKTAEHCCLGGLCGLPKSTSLIYFNQQQEAYMKDLSQDQKHLYSSIAVGL